MAQTKKRIYQIGFIVLLMWFGISLFSLFGTGYLTQYLETGLIPGIIHKFGITQFALDFRGIGLSGIDVGTVRIGPPENPALIVRSIHVDYSPGDLFRKKVRQISLSGVTIRCGISDGSVSLPGIDLQSFLRKDQKKGAESSSEEMVVPVDRFEIFDGTLLVSWENNEYRIPFEAAVFSEAENRFSLKVRVFPRNEAISITGDVQLIEKMMRLSIFSKDIQVSRFADIIEYIPGLRLTGDLDITGNAEFEFSPFSVKSADTNLTWKKFSVGYNTIEIQRAITSAQMEDHFNVRMMYEQGNVWQINMSGASMVSPLPFTLSDIDLDFSTNQDDVFINGNLSIHSLIHTTAAVSAKYQHDGVWHMSLSNAHDREGKKGHFEAWDMDITMDIPGFRVDAEGRGRSNKVNWDATFPNIRMKHSDTGVFIPAIKVTGMGESVNKLISGDIRVDIRNTSLDSGTTQLKIPEMSFSGHFGKEDNKKPLFKGMCSLSKGMLADRNARLGVKGIEAAVPLSWPLDASVKPGHFAVDAIRIKEFALGGVSGMIQQKGLGVIWSGTHASQLLPGLTVDFSGEGAIRETGGYGGHVRFDVPEYTPASDLDLGMFVPTAEGILFAGKLQGKGEIDVSSNGTDGFFEVSLNDGRISSEEKKIEVEGIYGNVRFPGIPDIESAPDQKVGFARAAFGEVVLENGEVRYKVESPESFFIEKGGFGWCNGQIETQSFRILAGIEDYDVIFYCSKLELAQVIQQITSFSAEGGGTVSGRIPLIYKNGDIAFKNGFLFSEPGVTGRIRIRDIDMLTDGVMAGAPKFAQLVLAQEALKNYEYKWAKLELNSEKENLLVSLRFDGKPFQALPFHLNKKTGQLVKDDSGKSKAVFEKGLSLDINTSLPLNDMLKYKDIITKKLK